MLNWLRSAGYEGKYSLLCLEGRYLILKGDYLKIASMWDD